MKTSNKIIILGINLMLVTITFKGLTTSDDIEKNVNSISLPVFELRFFNGIFDYHHPNVSIVDFHVYFENSSDDDLNLQFLYFSILDENGKMLCSYRPEVNVTCYYLQFHTAEFTLKAKEKMSLTSLHHIKRDSINQYCWNYLSSASNNVRICGVYKLNGEMQWFETNLYEINIPLCK